MDLREKKTRASIRRAYLELRAEKGAGRITVRELADRAQVGKATFYLHYRSIYDLSEALQREAIEMIVAGIEEPAALLTAPDRASWQLFSSFEKHRELIDVLFRGEQAAVLSQGIEEAVRARLEEILPEACDDPRLSALVTFQVQGGFFAYRRCVGSGRGAADPSGGDVIDARRAPRLTRDEQQAVVTAIADAVRVVGALMEHVAAEKGLSVAAASDAERTAPTASSYRELGAKAEGIL